MGDEWAGFTIRTALLNLLGSGGRIFVGRSQELSILCLLSVLLSEPIQTPRPELDLPAAEPPFTAGRIAPLPPLESIPNARISSRLI